MHFSISMRNSCNADGILCVDTQLKNVNITHGTDLLGATVVIQWENRTITMSAFVCHLMSLTFRLEHHSTHSLLSAVRRKPSINYTNETPRKRITHQLRLTNARRRRVQHFIFIDQHRKMRAQRRKFKFSRFSCFAHANPRRYFARTVVFLLRLQLGTVGESEAAGQNVTFSGAVVG